MKSSLVCIYFFVILCVCAHTYHSAQCVCRSEDYLQEYILSFYHEGSEVGRLGAAHSYSVLLSCWFLCILIYITDILKIILKNLK